MPLFIANEDLRLKETEPMKIYVTKYKDEVLRAHTSEFDGRDSWQYDRKGTKFYVGDVVNLVELDKDDSTRTADSPSVHETAPAPTDTYIPAGEIASS